VFISGFWGKIDIKGLKENEQDENGGGNNSFL